MHYPGSGMQGGHFDTTGYQTGLFGTSAGYDGSSIKLHHGHYPEPVDSCYNGYLTSTSNAGNFISREPPSYSEAAVFQGFVPNSSTSYYKVNGRTSDVGEYGVHRPSDSMLLKTEVVLDNNLAGSDVNHRYHNVAENRVISGIDVNVRTDDDHSVKLENDVSNFKTDLSINDSLSHSDSTECISPQTEVKDEDCSSKPTDTTDGQRDAESDDKSQTNSDIKPALSYIALIAKAILECPQKRLSLGSIYAWIEKNYPYYLNRGQGWRNSVRHNLSLNDCFVKAGRCEDGKGNYWAIHPANIQDFMRGDFRQRRRSRRRGRKKDCDLGMYMSNGYLGTGSTLGAAVPFSPASALSTFYSPYTDAERRAYRLDDALLRQSMNNPFMKWYHGNVSNGTYPNQTSTCNTGVYGSTSPPQWQTGYSDQGSQSVYPLNAFSSRNYTTPTLV